MFKIVKQVLSVEQVAEIGAKLAVTKFIDGKHTAQGLAQQAKNNLQLDPEAGADIVQLLTNTLAQNAALRSLSLPSKVKQVVVSAYTAGMDYGLHMDSLYQGDFRTDLSVTLFLNDPSTYEGGELVVETEIGEQLVKLPAGDMVIYPSGRLHRVKPVVSGTRLAAVSWIQSQVRDNTNREILVSLNNLLAELKGLDSETTDGRTRILGLSKTIHSLERMWRTG